MSQVVKSGLTEVFKNKLAEGESPSMKDLLAMCEVITHNATLLTNVENRISKLEEHIKSFLLPEPKESPPTVQVKCWREEVINFNGAKTIALVFH